MTDDDKLRQFTDADGNLHVDQLVGLQLKRVSVLPYGANGREVTAARENQQVGKTSKAKIIQRGANAARRAINWINDDELPPEVVQAGRDAYQAAFDAHLQRTGEPAPIKRLATDFNGVMQSEFAWDSLWLFASVWRETLINILIMEDSDNDDDVRGQIVAACNALTEITLRLLDSTQEFTMTAPPAELRRHTMEDPTMPIDAETRAALDAIRSDLTKTAERVDGLASSNTRMGALWGHVLRENGLPDDHLTAVLQQFSITGQNPISSRVGDVAALFGSNITAPMQAALVGMGNLFRSARGVALEGDAADKAVVTTDVLREAIVGATGFIAGKVREVTRGARPTPPGTEANPVRRGSASAPTFRNPDKVLRGIGGVVDAMEERWSDA